MKSIWVLVWFALLGIGCGGGNGSPPPAPPTAPDPPPGDPPPPPPPPPSAPPSSPPTFPNVRLVEFATGFVQPLGIGGAGDGSGRLFVVERGGVVHAVTATGATERFLDVTDRVRSSSGEQGLLGLAFSPDFATDRRLYVNYTDLDGDSVVARFTAGAAGPVDTSTEQVLLRIPQPFTNHNGGHLAFGPDGYLYIASGDGGGSGDPDDQGQDRTTLLGTLLRIDVGGGADPYAIPATNPFGDEVWAFGLRNPWRFSFDRATGDLYVADVGEKALEEVNFQAASGTGGDNYGWSLMEGSACFREPNCDPVAAGITLPVWEYENAGGNCSVTGGYVYRGADMPELGGIYVYGDFCSGRIWGLARAGDEWHNATLLDSTLMITSFGEDDTGELFVAGYTDGTVYRVVVDD